MLSTMKPLLLLLLVGAAQAVQPLLRARREAPEDGDRPHIQLLLEAEAPHSNGSNTHCRLPVDVGPCKAALPRFFYNVSSESCVSFIFGGCNGNDNNYESEEECVKRCSGVTGTVLSDDSPPAPSTAPPSPDDPPSGKSPRMAPSGPDESDPPASLPLLAEMSAEDFAERCKAEPVVGHCRAAFPRWYYNKNTGSCQPFIYGGCKGNLNNYHTKERCSATCSVKVLPSTKKLADDEDLCTVTADPGPCRAAFPMYYYDPNSATCQLFLYGGCQGNMNRFGTVEECLSRCGLDGEFGGRNQSRSRWTSAAFLFATLAVISLLLLATLIIITLRRNRLPRRPSSISDKEELLPDEQSSLDSLSLPESPTPAPRTP